MSKYSCCSKYLTFEGFKKGDFYEKISGDDTL